MLFEVGGVERNSVHLPVAARVDEEFGPENFVAEVAWRKRTSVANDSANWMSTRFSPAQVAMSKPSMRQPWRFEEEKGQRAKYAR